MTFFTESAIKPQITPLPESPIDGRWFVPALGHYNPSGRPAERIGRVALRRGGGGWRRARLSRALPQYGHARLIVLAVNAFDPTRARRMR
jgi:hypothetical protein